LDLPAHAGAGGDGQRARLHVPADDAALEQLHPLGVLDVALELPTHGHSLGPHLPIDIGAGIDGEVAVHLHVALEAAGDAYVAGADDLALDGEIGSDDGLFHFRALLVALLAGVRNERRDVGALWLPREGVLRWWHRALTCRSGSRV